MLNKKLALGRYSFISSIFNDKDTGSVMASGRVAHTAKERNKGDLFSIVCGIKSMQFDQNFLDRLRLPVVNIRVTSAVSTPMPIQKRLPKKQLFFKD